MIRAGPMYVAGLSVRASCFAPVRLDLDLDAYEGSPRHAARLRGASGWLVVAEARVEGESAVFETILTVGCDQFGTPLPRGVATRLLDCAIGTPGECDELPPDELDDALEEGEGALVRRWLRMRSAAWREHLRGVEERIAAIEMNARRYTDAGERQVAELRRRRRLALDDHAARDAIDAVIRGIEAENIAAMRRAAARRAALRADAERVEDALLATVGVAVRSTTLWRVHWRTRPTRGEDWLEVEAQLKCRPSFFDPCGSGGPRGATDALEGRVEDLLASLRPMPRADAEEAKPREPRPAKAAEEKVKSVGAAVNVASCRKPRPLRPVASRSARKIAKQLEAAMGELERWEKHAGDASLQSYLRGVEACRMRVESLRAQLGGGDGDAGS